MFIMSNINKGLLIYFTSFAETNVLSTVLKPAETLFSIKQPASFKLSAGWSSFSQSMGLIEAKCSLGSQQDHVREISLT